MISISNINELTTAKKDLDHLKKDYPILFETFLDVTNLTRAFQFKYHYFGCLLMDENPGTYAPNFVYGSVLRLYKKEIQKLKNDSDIQVLRQIFSTYKKIGYAKLCLLVLDQTPESLKGISPIK